MLYVRFNFLAIDKLNFVINYHWSSIVSRCHSLTRSL